MGLIAVKREEEEVGKMINNNGENWEESRKIMNIKDE